MPEMTFSVRWPDGAETSHYSPSLVMHDHLEAGARYPLADFVARTGAALGEASDRVRAKYGMACTSAMQSQQTIAATAAHYPADVHPTAEVEVLTMEPQLERTGS